MTTFVNPLDLPLTPPMDLNPNFPKKDKISPYPMQLRTRGSVGLFATRRDVQNGLLRTHAGIDLLAPIGTKVFASANGNVIQDSGNSILILHDYGFKFLTFYQHLQNKIVSNGNRVVSGQQIGEVGVWDNKEDHLHFEVRYPFDNNSPSYDHSLPINPTFAMYYWEIKTFENLEDRNVIDNVYISGYEEIIRARHLRFIMCNVSGKKRDLFLSIQTGLKEDDSLAETIRLSFIAKKKVRITWRKSLFFSKIQKTYEHIAIIAEIKVYK